MPEKKRPIKKIVKKDVPVIDDKLLKANEIILDLKTKLNIAERENKTLHTQINERSKIMNKLERELKTLKSEAKEIIDNGEYHVKLKYNYLNHKANAKLTVKKKEYDALVHADAIY